MARMIDADELVKVIENLLYEPDSVQYIWSSDVLSAIRSAPTVQPVPAPHGRWEDRGSLSCRCSRCGCKSNAEYNYCPHCGAKIDGEEE